MNVNKRISAQDVKDIEINILDYIDSICKKHHIEYFLGYGTLLGAIRHKGFIPWDDDIDICMKRKDYEKFISVLSNEQHETYNLLHSSIDSTYYYEIAKVVDVRTKVIGHEVDDIPNEGVWVDIFPLDAVSKHQKFQRYLVKVCMVFRIMSVYKKFPAHKRSYLFYPLWLIARLVGFKLPLKITDWLSKSGTNENIIGYIAAMSTTGSKYCSPASWFKETVEVDFEGKKYPAPKAYHDYLKSKYGDYMKLPPENKRVGHPVEAYWR